jgi:enoyl-CoA hydratase
MLCEQGLELAMAADILVASERATFADTHALVGVMPSWGMSVLLPERVGRIRAKQMSLSGEYISAATACEWGLINKVVPHDELLGEAARVAHAIAEAPTAAIRAMLTSLDASAEAANGEAWERERQLAAKWAAEELDAKALQARVAAVFERGRAQAVRSP